MKYRKKKWILRYQKFGVTTKVSSKSPNGICIYNAIHMIIQVYVITPTAPECSSPHIQLLLFFCKEILLIWKNLNTIIATFRIIVIRVVCQLDFHIAWKNCCWLKFVVFEFSPWLPVFYRDSGIFYWVQFFRIDSQFSELSNQLWVKCAKMVE